HHLFSPLFAAAATSTRHHHCLRRCFLLYRYLPPLLLHSLEKDEQQDAHGESRRWATQTEKRQDNTDDGVQVAIAFHHRVAFQIYYYITTSASASPSCSGSASCAHLHLYVGFQICRCITGVVSPSLPLQSSNGSCSLRKCTKNRKGKNGYIINGWGWVEERRENSIVILRVEIKGHSERRTEKGSEEVTHPSEREDPGRSSSHPPTTQQRRPPRSVAAHFGSTAAASVSIAPSVRPPSHLRKAHEEAMELALDLKANMKASADFGGSGYHDHLSEAFGPDIKNIGS
ncbi:hypothetical protein PIB30_049820, partial [Stylosanthes scabra]|nr:hypothetical protein [Stylosanthes scabra]